MSNLDLQIPDSLIDVQHSFDGALGDQNDESEWCAAGATVFPDSLRIPRSEWADRIREHEKYSSSADFFSDHFTDQRPSHECVSHAAMQAFTVAYNRQYGGNSHSVWFSPLALYTRITGGREWGGSMVHDSLREMISRGMLPEYDGPGGDNDQFNRFKHTVHQTSGSRSKPHWEKKGWITPRELPSGWEETAKHFRVLEAFTIPDREAHVSALLHGWAVANGRSGHSIPHMNMVIRDGKYYSRYKDSYFLFRFDSENMLGGGYCIRAVTMSDDPNKPAADQMK